MEQNIAKKVAVTFHTDDLSNRKVWMGHPKKNDPDAVKKVGRIRAFVFHPKRAKVVGFLVKRPDVALMFHRDDMFVAFDGFEINEGDITVKTDAGSVGKAALKKLGVRLDDCVLWIGLPVMDPSGRTYGIADDVEFDSVTGNVVALNVGQGATANALLGKRSIPGKDVLGFRRGQGAKLWLTDDDDDNPEALGAVIVTELASNTEVVGGVAEKAGAATAIVGDKAKKGYDKVVKKVKPKAQEATKAAGEAVTKGAYATGRQIARSQGMFGKFKDEFKKAMNDDES